MKKGRTGCTAAAREGYAPGLEEELRDCLDKLQYNENTFQNEIRPDLVEECIYRHLALECRYAYLIKQARRTGLRGAV